MPSKMSYTEVKKYIESKGFILLTTNYINSLQKLTISCPKHGIQEVTFKWLRKGTGCFKCGQEIKGALLRHPIEFIEKEVSNAGYILISKIYENDKAPLLMECPRHGIFTSCYEFIRGKHGCKDCGYEKIGDKKRTPFENVKELISKTPYTLISKTRISHKQKIVLLCEIHGEFEISLDRLKIGQGCFKCGHAQGSKKRRKSPDDFYKKITHFGYEILTPYTTSHTPISVKCLKHGIFEVVPYSLLNGHGCPGCAHIESEPEKEVLKYISEMGLDTVPNSRKIISPFELDIHVPCKKIALEYCGLHWHSERFKNDNNSHIKKMKMCNEKGIRLITIFEDEWLERKDQVKNYLLSVMGKNPINIGARKTELCIVNKKEAESFLEQNHIQGSTRMDMAWGLYYKKELVAIMSGDNHHRQGQEGIFILNRLAFKTGISIQGGSSKLLKALISYAKERGYLKLVSWSDGRWSEGRVYEKMGFVLEEEMGADYSYVKGQKRISKQSCQKKNLIKKGAKGTMANTERELALSLGLYRIYDCGKKRWTIDLSQ